MPTGAIALVDRGFCNFTVKVANAQSRGASAVIVADNAPGIPTTMGGADPSIIVPSVRVSLADGNTIKAGLPASGTIALNEERGCGSHTATGVPDRRNDRLLVYNSCATATTTTRTTATTTSFGSGSKRPKRGRHARRPPSGR